MRPHPDLRRLLDRYKLRTFEMDLAILAQANDSLATIESTERIRAMIHERIQAIIDPIPGAKVGFTIHPLTGWSITEIKQTDKAISLYIP